MTFKEMILQGMPDQLPNKKSRDDKYSHAPKRKDILRPPKKN